MITKDMSIVEVIQNYPETLGVFMQYGMGCVGCALASFESVEEGALVHGLDVDQLVSDLNALVSEKEDSEEGQK